MCVHLPIIRVSSAGAFDGALTNRFGDHRHIECLVWLTQQTLNGQVARFVETRAARFDPGKVTRAVLHPIIQYHFLGVTLMLHELGRSARRFTLIYGCCCHFI